ncbi:MAG: endoglycosylceramidase [Pseudonocardiales bacterium]|nr:endoglycosylceramidase [Pseudonocardiales bacterium]
MRRVRVVLITAALALLTAPALSGAAAADPPPPATGLAALGLDQTGRWITDATGRVVVLHGVNQVYKVAPYAPSTDGFDDDDAAFLADNGFNAVRVGVIWSAVEPRPGQYDDAYLDSVASTVHTLAAHGIVSQLDFHQDLYNEKFQGEGAPAWAVPNDALAGLLPNPPLGFPYNYLANPAEWHAWDRFWANAKAADGVGLQDHYARAWAHVAARFATDRAVAGYDVMNEPWAGTLWEPCLLPLIGCPLFDGGALTAFYNRVDAAIRTVDPTHTIYIEPNVLFTQVNATGLRSPSGARRGFSFHDYCSTEELTGNNALCPPQDDLTVATANRFAQSHDMPALLTEFGATNDLANVASVMRIADKYRTGWLEWAYTGNDKTSASPDGQALVLDPSKPPIGANVLTAKLRTLAEPYPQLVAGTPTSWSFANGVFRLTYTTARVDGFGAFSAGTATEIAVPAIQFPGGYRVAVSGATVVSAPNAATLRLASLPGATTVQVAVSAA